MSKLIIKHLINEAKNLKINKLSIETGAGEFFHQQENFYKFWF